MPGDPALTSPGGLDPFASEARVRELVEHLPVVVYIDTDDRPPSLLYLSPKIEEILGYPAEAYTQDRELWKRSMHEDDRARVRELRDTAWREGSPFRAEFRMIRPDGREVWIRDSCVLVRGDDGARLAWQGVLEDITPEKRNEQDIRASEARYRALVDRVPAVVYEMGPDDERRTLFVSPHVEEVLGYSRAEWLEQPDIWIELLHRDDREVVLARHDLHSQTGDSWDLEYRLIASDGSVVWVHDRGTLIRGRDGRPDSWHGVMIDVTSEHEAKEMLLLTKEDLERRVAERTAALEEANELMTLEIEERRRIERELREARERFQRLVENLPGISYLWEIGEDAPHRTFTYVSPRVEEMLGYPGDRFDAWSRVHPHDRDRVAAATRASASTGEAFRAEYRLLARDGHVIWVLDHASLIARTQGGDPQLFQGVMLNITPRKRAESQAEAAEDRFRTLTELGPVVAYTFDLLHDVPAGPPRLRITYASPQIAGLLGYPHAHWLDDPAEWFDMVHPDDRDLVTEQTDRIWRTGEDWAFRYRMLRSDGGILTLHDTGRMLERDRSGRPHRFLGFLIDVSKEAEERDRTALSESSHRTALEGARVIPWTEAVDPETGSERYTYIGPQSEAILGYTPDELMVEREHFSRMVHPDDRERVLDTSARSEESGIWIDEYRVIRRDGDVRWLHSYGRRASPPGVRPEIWHGVAVDVTASKEWTPEDGAAVRGGAAGALEPDAG